MKRITRPQFDMLDRLHALDAHLCPLLRENLALELGDITPEAAHLRMRRLSSAGLVEIIQQDRSSPAYYRVTAIGVRLYHDELERMDDEPTEDSPPTATHACPGVLASMQRALEATTLLHLTEPKRGAA